MELAILAACSTGLGKVERGEGVISFSRAFSMAGARSVFMTMWAARDQKANQVVSSFLYGLSEGKALDEALQTAVLEILDQANAAEGEPLFAHPAYWASYQIVGETSNIPLKRKDQKDGKGTWFYLLLGTGLLLLVLTVLIIRRNRSRKS